MTTVDPQALVHRFDPGDESVRTTMLLLHGTGGDEHDLVPIASQLAPGAALLSPRGGVDEEGHQRFFRRHAEGVFDLDDLVARADELAAWARSACHAYQRPPGELIALGFSNGANIAWAAAARDPGLLRGAVLLAPMLPFDPADTPLGGDAAPGPDLSGLSVLIGAGRADPVAPPEQAEALATWLSECGAAVQVRWHAGGHRPDSEVFNEAREWLTRLRAAIGGDDDGVA